MRRLRLPLPARVAVLVSGWGTLLQALLDAGADRVSIADTVGYAGPAGVRRLFEQAVRIAGDRFWCGHFHDTRGLALANVFAAMQVGVERFDA